MDTPPPPPGFKLDAALPPPPGFKLDAPPPPPGFQINATSAKPASSAPVESSPPQRGSAAAAPSAPPKQGGTFLGLPKPTTLIPGKFIYDESIKEGRQNLADIKGDFTAPVQSHDKAGKAGKPGAMDYAARAGKTALDVIQRPFIVPNAAIKETVGEAAHSLSGGKLDPQAVSDAAQIAVPLSRAKMVGSAIEGTKEAFERLLSPTTVGKGAKATEGIIRKSGGTMNLAHEKAADTLVQHNKQVANLPVPEQRQMVADLENGRPQANPKLQPAADAVRKVYDGWKQKITQTLRPQDVPNFIQDYYAHIWKEKPGQVLGAISKQGSGRNFKLRTIPTIEDGLKAGLTPKYENPIEATTAYSQNMARYVATHDMLKELKTQGYAKWFTPGSKNVPKDWVPLDGIMTKKTAPVTATGAAGDTFLLKKASDYGLTLPQTTAEKTAAGKEPFHFIIMKNGQPHGAVLGDFDKKTGKLNIDSINAAQGPKSIGTAGTRKILDQLKKKFPNASAVSGERVSGARPDAENVSVGVGDKTPSGSGGRPIHLHAPPEVARVFNNFISKGFEQGDGKPFFEAARHISNGMTMLKLGLSTYHLGTMANESMISDYARAFRAASKGQIGTAAKAFVTAPTAPVKSYMRGMKMQRELLDKAMPDAVSKKVNDAFVRSGQTLRMDPFYRTRASGSFYNAFHKGTLGREIKDAAKNLYSGTAWEKAKGVADLTANVIQTTAAPLFEHYIPAVKRGAFASEMEDYLKANPTASQAEIDKEAIKVADSIDNRFGELNQDNLFWSRKMKQAAQIALLAPTWDLGTVREIGGGLKDIADIPKEGLSRRTAYVAGLAFNTALMSSIYQYMKTGKAPSSAQDLMAPKTGGTDFASKKPERAITPGYQKDVYAFGYDFPNHILQESANKLNPALQTATGLIQNKDYRGLPIMRPEGVKPVPGEPGLPDYLLDQFLPISVGQFKQGAKKGSNIGNVERGLSVRPAPAYMTDPKRVQDQQTHFGTLDWKRRIHADQRQKAQQQ